MKNLSERTLPHSNMKKCGAAGVETGVKFSGIVVTPNGIPMIVVIIIPIKIEPGTLSVYKTIVITSPSMPTIADACSRLKFTNATGVPACPVIIPAFASPIKVMNKPIPTATAFRKFNLME